MGIGQPGKRLGKAGSQQRIQRHKVFKLGNVLVHAEKSACASVARGLCLGSGADDEESSMRCIWQERVHAMLS